VIDPHGGNFRLADVQPRQSRLGRGPFCGPLRPDSRGAGNIPCVVLLSLHVARFWPGQMWWWHRRGGVLFSALAVVEAASYLVFPTVSPPGRFRTRRGHELRSGQP
jgi:hypothetical protein